MERTARIARFWSWLPAFRVVAETQHLPTAARKLHVSPSALSRTIRLLEDDLEHPLFERAGRNLVLNDAGRAFLASVRHAMREVHEGLETVAGDRYAGTLGVAAPGPYASFIVLPALADLTAAHPRLRPVLRSIPDIGPALRRGDVDLALTDDPFSADDLAIEHLLDVTHSVYAGPDHPLPAGDAPLDAILQAHFVAPTDPGGGPALDAWPPYLERTVTLRVDQVQVAIEAARSGRYLVALPDLIGRRSGLRALPGVPLSTCDLLLVRRPPLGMTTKADLLRDAIRAMLAR